MAVQWFTLTREFVEYTLTSTFASNVLMAMTRAGIPDESFFQVQLMNSHFNNTVGQIVRYHPPARPCSRVFIMPVLTHPSHHTPHRTASSTHHPDLSVHHLGQVQL